MDKKIYKVLSKIELKKRTIEAGQLVELTDLQADIFTGLVEFHSHVSVSEPDQVNQGIADVPSVSEAQGLPVVESNRETEETPGKAKQDKKQKAKKGA